jgi:undecaprenyl-diphosphatase
MLGFHPPGEVFPIVIQFGAILAVVAVYWRRFWDVLITLPSSRESRNFTLGVILATLPAAVAGGLLHDKIKDVLFAPEIAPKVIAATLILGGILILIFERLAPPPRYLDGDKLPLSKAFQIGLFQVLALVPGVSRSGATILGGELAGIDRKAGALFTFYLAVPTMFGATVLDLWKNRHGLNMDAGLDIAIGFVVAFVVALFVVRSFIAFIGRYGLKPFGWYRIAAGLAIIAVLVLR